MSTRRSPVVAYRCWLAYLKPWEHPGTEDGKAFGLWPTNKFGRWPGPPDVLHATCNRPTEVPDFLEAPVEIVPQHTVPDIDCCCGLYAYSRPAIAQLHMESLGARKEDYILGAVLLWGNIISAEVAISAQLPESALLFRAEYGRVIALRREDKWSELLGERLGLRVVPENFLEATALEHGEHFKRLVA